MVHVHLPIFKWRPSLEECATASEGRYEARSVSAAAAIERLETLADSTGRRNTFAESLSGRLEAERLARPLVQLSGDRVELVL